MDLATVSETSVDAIARVLSRGKDFRFKVASITDVVERSSVVSP